MSEADTIHYCRDCRHRQINPGGKYEGDLDTCLSGPVVRMNFVTGVEIPVRVWCEIKNGNGRCAEWTQR